MDHCWLEAGTWLEWIGGSTTNETWGVGGGEGHGQGKDGRRGLGFVVG